MECVENRALSKLENPAKVWKRYVDDTFGVINGAVPDQFFTFLNSIQPSNNSVCSWKLILQSRL